MSSPRPKVFEIGLGRTGTTSLTLAAERLGLRSLHWGREHHGEFLGALLAGRLPDVLDEYDFVSDCVAGWYAELDARYPGSKFVLSTRNEDDWLRSFQDQHRQWRFRPGFDFLTQYQLQKFGCFSPLKNPDRFREAFRAHERAVRTYFAGRPDDLLVIDVCAGEGWEKLCPFLGVPIPDDPFPHANRTADTIRLPSRPSTVVLAWEVGAGLGHLRPHRDVFAALLDAGHEVHVVTRELGRLRAAFGDLPIRGWQTPLGTSRPVRPFRPTRTFAHILHNIGFLATDDTAARIEAWSNLFDAIDPDLVLADYAPTALLALRGTSIPRLSVGGGFWLPPDRNPLPPLPGYREASDPATLAADERRVVDRVNAALERTHRPTISSIGEWFNDGVDPLLLTFPELDPYAADRTTGTYLGPAPTPPGSPVDWPPGTRRRVFAYLKPFDAMETLFGLLNELGLPTVVAGDGLPSEVTRKHASSNLRFSRTAVDLAEAAATCHFAITNGNHATTCHFLLAGKPVVCIPLNLEQRITATLVEQLGAGATIRPTEPRDVYERFTDVLNDTACQEAATRFAESHAGHDPSRYVDTVLGRLAAIEGRSTP